MISEEKKNYSQIYGKLSKVTEHLLAKLHVLASNLLKTIFFLVLYHLDSQINYVKFNSERSYLPSDSYINTVNSDCFAYLSKWGRKTVMRSMSLHLTNQVIKNWVDFATTNSKFKVQYYPSTLN